MTLVDTSVWVDHMRRANPRLQALLADGQATCHPFVIGELACGTLRRRKHVLGHLARLPVVPVASHTEALRLVEGRGLMGRGLGWVDIHLLASALLAGEGLWTLDRPLAQAAHMLGCAATPQA